MVQPTRAIHSHASRSHESGASFRRQRSTFQGVSTPQCPLAPAEGSQFLLKRLHALADASPYVAQPNAHAYAQGADIHVALGREHHPPPQAEPHRAADPGSGAAQA
jgi:hypothetical protein